MGVNRLIEITTKMKEIDGPVGVMGVLTSLNDSDMYLFMRYIKSSRYEGMSLWEAILAFSNDYLNSKKIVEEVNEELEEANKFNMNNLFANNENVVFAHHSSR